MRSFRAIIRKPGAKPDPPYISWARMPNFGRIFLTITILITIVLGAYLALQPSRTAFGLVIIAAITAGIALFTWLYPRRNPDEAVPRTPDASVNSRSSHRVERNELTGETVKDTSGRPQLPGDICWNMDRLQRTDSRAIGRESELLRLDQSLSSDKTHIVMLCAWAGVGKTALVNQWLTNLQGSPDAPFRRAFGWSFNNQTNQAAVTVSQFLHEISAWLGDPTPDYGSAWARGQRLANFLRRDRTLLILDGLESLMSSDGLAASRIVEPAISALLIELAKASTAFSSLLRDAQHRS